MKASGSRDKLFATAATAPSAALGSTSLSLVPLHLQPCPKQDATGTDVEQWMRAQEEWGRQRAAKKAQGVSAVEAGKPAGSPKPPAGSFSSSSSSSVSKQATARQRAAELIRLGDTSLSASLLSASGAGDNLPLLQVNQESSSSATHASAGEHASSREGKKDKEPAGEPAKTRLPRNLRVASLEEMPGTFTTPKKVMDMQYCVQHLEELRSLAGRNNLSMFSDFWAPDHKNTTPMKPVFLPEKLVAGNEPLLAQFYDGGRITTRGDADPINPPHFRISRENSWVE
jgi:hypothetical protein